MPSGKSHALIIAISTAVVMAMYGLPGLPAMLAGYAALLVGQWLFLRAFDFWFGIEDE